MSLTGAMTPAGLGMSTIIPLIEAGLSIGSFPRAPISITTRTWPRDGDAPRHAVRR